MSGNLHKLIFAAVSAYHSANQERREKSEVESKDWQIWAGPYIPSLLSENKLQKGLIVRRDIEVYTPFVRCSWQKLFQKIPAKPDIFRVERIVSR